MLVIFNWNLIDNSPLSFTHMDHKVVNDINNTSYLKFWIRNPSLYYIDSGQCDLGIFRSFLWLFTALYRWQINTSLCKSLEIRRCTISPYLGIITKYSRIVLFVITWQRKLYKIFQEECSILISGGSILPVTMSEKRTMQEDWSWTTRKTLMHRDDHTQ